MRDQPDTPTVNLRSFDNSICIKAFCGANRPFGHSNHGKTQAYLGQVLLAGLELLSEGTNCLPIARSLLIHFPFKGLAHGRDDGLAALPASALCSRYQNSEGVGSFAVGRASGWPENRATASVIGKGEGNERETRKGKITKKVRSDSIASGIGKREGNKQARKGKKRKKHSSRFWQGVHTLLHPAQSRAVSTRPLSLARTQLRQG